MEDWCTTSFIGENVSMKIQAINYIIIKGLPQTSWWKAKALLVFKQPSSGMTKYSKPNIYSVKWGAQQECLAPIQNGMSETT